MIVQCVGCKSRLRVAEEKIPTEGSLKMRCPKCKTIFCVKRPEDAPDSSLFDASAAKVVPTSPRMEVLSSTPSSSSRRIGTAIFGIGDLGAQKIPGASGGTTIFGDASTALPTGKPAAKGIASDSLAGDGPASVFGGANQQRRKSENGTVLFGAGNMPPCSADESIEHRESEPLVPSPNAMADEVANSLETADFFESAQDWNSEDQTADFQTSSPAETIPTHHVDEVLSSIGQSTRRSGTAVFGVFSSEMMKQAVLTKSSPLAAGDEIRSEPFSALSKASPMTSPQTAVRGKVESKVESVVASAADSFFADSIKKENGTAFSEIRPSKTALSDFRSATDSAAARFQTSKNSSDFVSGDAANLGSDGSEGIEGKKKSAVVEVVEDTQVSEGADEVEDDLRKAPSEDVVASILNLGGASSSSLVEKVGGSPSSLTGDAGAASGEEAHSKQNFSVVSEVSGDRHPCETVETRENFLQAELDEKRLKEGAFSKGRGDTIPDGKGGKKLNRIGGKNLLNPGDREAGKNGWQTEFDGFGGKDKDALRIRRKSSCMKGTLIIAALILVAAVVLALAVSSPGFRELAARRVGQDAESVLKAQPSVSRLVLVNPALPARPFNRKGIRLLAYTCRIRNDGQSPVPAGIIQVDLMAGEKMVASTHAVIGLSLTPDAILDVVDGAGLEALLRSKIVQTPPLEPGEAREMTVLFMGAPKQLEGTDLRFEWDDLSGR